MSDDCSHLDDIRDVTPSALGCEECLRRRRDDDARIIAETQPEHQHVPRLWIPPGGYFITPRGVVLRPPQALRLVGAVGCRNGPVRPISYAAEDAVIRRVAAAFVEPLRSALEVRNQ